MAYKTLSGIKNDSENELAKNVLHNLQLLTGKPGILLLNISEKNPSLENEDLKKYLDSFGFPICRMNIKEEMEGAEFLDQERRERGVGPSRLLELLKMA